MPRHMLPQVGTLVWYFADPTRRPQAAIVTKRISKVSYNLTYFAAQTGTATAVTAVPFIDNPGSSAAAGAYCTPTGIQDTVDGATDGTSASQRAQSVVVTAGGTGYTVGNVLTLPANTGPVILTVVTAAGGIISAVSITNAGNTVKPGPVPAQAATGGSGSGATFTVTWVDN
jgi:hypothetical protein